jgi:hypothetical protein
LVEWYVVPRTSQVQDEGTSIEERSLERRIAGSYGRAPASWIDLDGLIAIKERIDHPRHREDVRVLELVRLRRKR